MRVFLILLMFILSACGGSQTVAPVGTQGYKYSQAKTSQSKHTISQAPKTYNVKKGDTLYSISWRYGMDYKTIAKINNIRSPYNIYVGQKLTFKSSRKVTKTSTWTKKKTGSTKTTKANTTNQRLTWRWPTKGKLISTYSKNAAGRKGINISGQSGQKIIAAASGKVVYSGNGLPRYGNLLIIKHNEVYLSAYAHNKTLLVKEGQYVKSGQRIATLGRTGTQKNQLHFEIRRNGKPVDPLRFLPKK